MWQRLNLVERMPAALTSTAFNIYASLVLTLSSESSSSHAFSRMESPPAAATLSLGLSLIEGGSWWEWAAAPPAGPEVRVGRTSALGFPFF